MEEEDGYCLGDGILWISEGKLLLFFGNSGILFFVVLFYNVSKIIGR